MTDSFTGPIFLVGMPRSGTKLLRALLNAHPDIHIPLNETEFLPTWERRWASFGDLADHRRFVDFYAQVTQTFYLPIAAVHGAPICSWYCACNGDFSNYRFRDLNAARFRAGERGIWGDKSLLYRSYSTVDAVLSKGEDRAHCTRCSRLYLVDGKVFWKISAARCPSLVRLAA